MKHMTTLSTVALLLAAGSFTLAGCSKSEQAASTGTGPEVAVQQPAGEQAPVTSDQATSGQAAPDQATADPQAAPAGTEPADNAPGTVAGETE
jgi:hypothetical protein